MPVSDVVDTANRLIVTTCWGVVTYSEVIEHQNRLRGNPDFSPEYSQIIDATGVTSVQFSSDEAQILVRRLPFKSGSYRALAASSPAVFGMARMLQTLRELAGGEECVAVFADLSSAVKWLDEKRRI